MFNTIIHLISISSDIQFNPKTSCICKNNSKSFRYREKKKGERFSPGLIHFYKENNQMIDYKSKKRLTLDTSSDREGYPIFSLIIYLFILQQDFNFKHRIWWIFAISIYGFRQFLQRPFHIQSESFLHHFIHFLCIFMPVYLHLKQIIWLELYVKDKHLFKLVCKFVCHYLKSLKFWPNFAFQ